VTAIRAARGDDDLERYVDLRRRLDDLAVTAVEDQRVFLRLAETPLLLLAADVAYGFVARYPGEADAVLDVGVLPSARRQGLGRALFDRLVAHARGARWTAVVAHAVEEDGVAWLRRRGFVDLDRQERVVLELADAPVDAAPVAGVHLVDFAARPDLAATLHSLLVEGVADVPGGLAEDVPELAAWLAAQEAPSRRPEFLVIALDGDEPIGYAQLHVYPRVGYHGFTVVARRARRRGIARLLKLELVRRARAAGLERLITNSNVDNVPMRALNADLGYRPAPPQLFLRRALAQ